MSAGEPILARQIRPLVREAVPVARELPPTLSDLRGVTPDLIRAFRVLNYVVNELAYNPPEPAKSYLFWTAWFFHNANSVLSLEDEAVDATLVACFLNAGQSCTAGESILVHERVHDAFLTKLAAATRERIQLGDPFDPLTTMGPLNNDKNAAKSERHVADAIARGASVVTGGSRDESFGSPLFFEPTILDRVTPEMAIAREETFGPVVPISTINSLEEALDNLKNDHEFLLKGDVFTADVIEAWIDTKVEKELNPVRLRPTPMEFALYFDI